MRWLRIVTLLSRPVEARCSALGPWTCYLLHVCVGVNAETVERGTEFVHASAPGGVEADVAERGGGSVARLSSLSLGACALGASF